MKASPDGRITRWRNRSPGTCMWKTLFVPSHVQGFVAGDSGEDLAAPGPLTDLLPPRPPNPAIDAATTLVARPSERVTGHVHPRSRREGTGHHALVLPEKPDWSWNQLFGKSDPVEWILAAGAEFDVDLIVMATKGQDSVGPLAREHNRTRAARARCPVLAIPASLI